MSPYVFLILTSVIFILSVSLFLHIKFRRKKIQSRTDSKNSWAASCKVCNTHVYFDKDNPCPTIWICPGCKAKNYTARKV